MTDAESHLMTVFTSALELSSDAEREEYLGRACAGNPALRERVEALLRAHGRVGDFLGRTPDPAQTAAFEPDAPNTSAPGNITAGTLIVGRYKLLERIGEGGMGEVWLAEQTEPVRRKVALKLIKAGMDSRQVLARFEAERQALALMDHPNIAKVLDAGATPEGRPFFVMELVKGTPITEYCDQHRLTPRDRLALFAQVCQAVQHAHQKGVIHRDIKPSNVLVAPYDGAPVPKVIDFGIAKAAGQPLTDKTLFTGIGAVVGTPEYMSPEQAELNNHDIDTRSDVYSLGVLLYELLTGTTPLTRKRLKETGLLEVLRLVREEEPPRPSTRLSTTDELPLVAANRGLAPKKLSGLVRGELDWIVMKALEKDRSRRYETATGLGEDVRRYLADEPVLACPPSALYRFRKFARKNRALLAAAATFAFVLVAGVIGTAVAAWQIEEAWQAERSARGQADEARGLAEARATQIAGDLQRLNDANAHLQSGRWLVSGGNASWDKAQAELDRAVELRPDHSQAWFERGEFYLRLGLWDLAERDFAAAFRLQKPSTPHPWLYHALLALYVGDVDAYQAMCREIPSRFTLHAAPDTPLPQMSDLTLYYLQSDFVRCCTLHPESGVDLTWALATVEAGVKRARSFPPGNLPALGAVYYRSGQYGKAIEALEEALKQNTLYLEGCYQNAFLAMAHHRLGHADQARAALAKTEKVIEKWRQTQFGAAVAPALPPLAWSDWMPCELLYREARLLVMGTAPPEDARSWVIRGKALAALKRDKEAADCRARALALAPHDISIRLSLLPAAVINDPAYVGGLEGAFKILQQNPDQPAGRKALADRYAQLGNSLQFARRHDEAMTAFNRAVEVDPDNKNALVGRASAYKQTRQWEKALADYDRVIQLDPTDAEARSSRGDVYQELGQPTKAAADYREAARLQKSKGTGSQPAGIDSMFLAERHVTLGRALAAGGKQDEAIAEYHEAIKIDKNRASPHIGLGDIWAAKGQWDEAIAEYQEALRLMASLFLYDGKQLHLKLGRALLAKGRWVEAALEYRNAVDWEPQGVYGWRSRAHIFAELRQWDRAAADFTKTLELDPKDATLWYDRGTVYLAWGQTEKAIADFTKVIELNRGYWEAWNDRGKAHLGRGQPDKALVDFSAAIGLNPKSAMTWINRSIVHQALRQDNEAVADASKAIELDPKRAPAWRARADAYRGLKRLDDAIADYQEALRLDSDSGTHNNYGLALLAQNRLDDAIAEFREAVRLKPDNAEGYFNLGSALRKKGLVDEAIAAWREGLRIKNDIADLHNDLGTLLYASWRWDDAIEQFHEAIRIDKGHYQAHFNLGLTLIAKGQTGEAIAAFRETVRIKKDFSAAYVHLGLALEKTGQSDEAVRVFRQTLPTKPDDAASHFRLGNYLNVEGSNRGSKALVDAAIAELREAVRIDKDSADAHNLLGAVLNGSSQWDEAIVEFREVVRINPKHVGAYMGLGYALAAKGKGEEAITACSKAIELAPKNWFVWARRGVIYRDLLGQPEKAVADFSKAIELDPKSVHAWHSRGVAYHKLGQFDNALADFSKAIELEPRFAPALSSRGILYCDNLDQAEKAVDDFSKLIDLEPKNATHWFNRGNAHRKSGEAEKAVDDYTRAIELDSKHIGARRNRALAHTALGRHDKALADSLRALELAAPSDAGVRNDLAWQLATCPDEKLRDPKRAVELAQRATELAPKDESTWGTLGAAHYRAGNWKDAITALEKSRELKPGWDAYAWLFLAMSHHKLGNGGESEKAFERAVEWLEKNKPLLEKNKLQADELRRFRAEAEEVLGSKKK